LRFVAAQASVAIINAAITLNTSRAFIWNPSFRRQAAATPVTYLPGVHDLPDQLVVLGVRPNPEPRYAVLDFDPECSITMSNANRAEPPDLLEAKRWMSWIVLEQLEIALPDHEQSRAISRKPARIPAWRDASNISAFASLVRSDRCICQPIQLPGGHVAFKLLLPELGIEFDEPAAKRSQLLRRQLLNLVLECLDLGHNVAFANSTASVA
jgi:hypothetical protein